MADVPGHRGGEEGDDGRFGQREVHHRVPHSVYAKLETFFVIKMLQKHAKVVGVTKIHHLFILYKKNQEEREKKKGRKGLK